MVDEEAAPHEGRTSATAETAGTGAAAKAGERREPAVADGRRAGETRRLEKRTRHAAPRRGRPPRPDVTAADVTGLKYFEKLAPLLERLHDVGCERDKAGNRELHYDELCLLLLLGLFNPVVDSLRGLQQASELEKVQKRLKLGRASLGSLSEASRVFDAELLKPIIEELGGQLQPLGRDRRLAEIPQTLTLVDGTLLSALPLLIQAMWLKEQTGSGLVKWRLHTHFEVDRFVPTRIDVTPNGGGEHDERAVLERTLEADRLYVMDRGYAKFALFNRIVAEAQQLRLPPARQQRVRGPGRTAAHRGRPRRGRAQRPTRALRQRQGRGSAGSSDAVRLCGHLAAHQSRQVPRRFHRSGQRRRAADRHQPARRAGGDHRSDLPLPLDSSNSSSDSSSRSWAAASSTSTARTASRCRPTVRSSPACCSACGPAASRPSGPTRWSAITSWAWPVRRSCWPTWRS